MNTLISSCEKMNEVPGQGKVRGGNSPHHYFWWNKVISITRHSFKFLLCFPVQVKVIIQSTAVVLKIMACQTTVGQKHYTRHQATELLAFSTPILLAG